MNNLVSFSGRIRLFIYVKITPKGSKFQRCPFNVGKPFFRWGYVILSQNKSDLVVF